MGPEGTAQPPAVCRLHLRRSPEQTFTQDSGSWVYKGEWNGTISDKLYLEARYGDFGYYFPLIANSADNFFWRDTGRAVLEGAHQIWQLDRDRKQYNLAATYFLDTGKGSHTFKMGGEMLKEQSWEGYLQQCGGNIDHIYNNGVSTQVLFDFPTATDAGKLSAHDCADVEGGARSDRRVHQRHVVGRPRHGERRRPLRPLSRLAARAGTACGAAVGPVPVAATAEDVPRDALLHLERGCAAHRPDLRPHAATARRC